MCRLPRPDCHHAAAAAAALVFIQFGKASSEADSECAWAERETPAQSELQVIDPASRDGPAPLSGSQPGTGSGWKVSELWTLLPSLSALRSVLHGQWVLPGTFPTAS